MSQKRTPAPSDQPLQVSQILPGGTVNNLPLYSRLQYRAPFLHPFFTGTLFCTVFARPKRKKGNICLFFYWKQWVGSEIREWRVFCTKGPFFAWTLFCTIFAIFRWKRVPHCTTTYFGVETRPYIFYKLWCFSCMGLGHQTYYWKKNFPRESCKASVFLSTNPSAL